MRNPILDHIQFFSDAQRAFMPFSSAAQIKSYPPYNVTQTDASTYEIEVACAGFSIDDLSVSQDKDVVVVEGVIARKSAPHEPNSNTSDIVLSEYPEFLHRGIAQRSFSLSFKFTETAVVDNVLLDNGILKVVISVPEAVKPEPKKFTIKTPTTVAPRGKGKGTVLTE